MFRSAENGIKFGSIHIVPATYMDKHIGLTTYMSMHIDPTNTNQYARTMIMQKP